MRGVWAHPFCSWLFVQQEVTHEHCDEHDVIRGESWWSPRPVRIEMNPERRAWAFATDTGKFTNRMYTVCTKWARTFH